jgi:Flp pilus assembly protein protease CpaA
MDISQFTSQMHFVLSTHGQQYKFYIESAVVAVLFYVGFTDFTSFKIRNETVLLLLILYVVFAFIDRSWTEILTDIIFATIMFCVLLWFYTGGAVGGGDVKLITVVCLWIGAHCALLFSALLLVLIGLHLVAATMGWARTKPRAGRLAIPYAPSVAGALIASIVLGCI